MSFKDYLKKRVIPSTIKRFNEMKYMLINSIIQLFVFKHILDTSGLNDALLYVLIYLIGWIIYQEIKYDYLLWSANDYREKYLKSIAPSITVMYPCCFGEYFEKIDMEESPNDCVASSICKFNYDCKEEAERKDG